MLPPPGGHPSCHNVVPDGSSPTTPAATTPLETLMYGRPGGLLFGLRLGTINGFTHFGVIRTRFPVFVCEFDAL